VTPTDPKPDPLAAFRPTPRFWLGLALFAGALLVYPWLIDAALARFGVRPVAAALCVATAAGGLVRFGPRDGRRLELPRVPGFPAAIAALPLAALATGDLRWLVLVSAAVHLWLCLVFAASLREPVSLIERAARFMQPRAPEFIRSYCRKVTALFALLFAGNAAAIAWLVAAGAGDARRWFATAGVWLPLAAVSLVEYAVRKAWFRYYAGGLLDRVWAALLPAENTERGRRSLAHIRRARDEMRAAGYTPPGEARRR